MHYSLDPKWKLVLMGDLNTGLCTRLDDDGPALRLIEGFRLQGDRLLHRAQCSGFG